MDEDNGVERVNGAGSPILKLLVKFLPFLIAIAIGAAGIYYIATNKPELLGLSKGQEAVQAEIDMLIAEVGKLIALPQDERPTIATVTEVDKIKDQPFFANAQNGDKVLIYTNAKKAILYRPSEKKIIEVGAVNIQQEPQEGGVGAEEVTPTPKPTNTPTPEPTLTPTETPAEGE